MYPNEYHPINPEQPPHPPMSNPPERQASGYALWAMILGLASFCLPLLILPAIILGIIGLVDVGSKNKTGLAFAITGIVSSILAGFVSVAVLLPAIQKVREAAARVQTQNFLKEISIGFQIYHDRYKKFPGHAIYSEDGEPLLSWRVAILPYIGEEKLYKKFKLDEPWDSPHNKKLISQIPEVYTHPMDPNPFENGWTYFQVFVGKPNEGRPSPLFVQGPGNERRMAEISDGITNTVLVVEASEPVFWTKPEDIPYSRNDPLPELGLFPSSICLALPDGSVQTIPRGFNERNFRNAITINDGINTPLE